MTLRILVVDDEYEIRRALRRFLESHGHSVYEALSGEMALRILEEEDIDVMLLDLRLGPQSAFDGWDVLRHKIASEKASRVPTIVISGLSLNEARDPEPRLPASHVFLSKPLDLAMLLRILASIAQRA